MEPKIHHPEGYEPIKKIPADSFRIIHESQGGYIRGNPGLDISLCGNPKTKKIFKSLSFQGVTIILTSHFSAIYESLKAVE